MKLLVSIATYGIKNLAYLNRVIDEYRSFKKHDIDITVHGTTALQRTDIEFILHHNPKTTVYFHRQEFLEKQDQYDLFIFSENDMLITEKNLDYYLSYEEKLPVNYCAGFLRFENTLEGIKHLIDLWLNVPGYDFIKSTDIFFSGERLFSVTNPHQAVYVLTKEKLKYVMANSNYVIDASDVGLETSSSGIFTDWYLGTGVLNKVIPLSREGVESCLIEHLPGNHCNPPGINANTPPDVFRRNCATEQQLFDRLEI